MAPYAIACHGCGYVEKWAYHPSSTAENNPKAGQRMVNDQGEPIKALTPRDHVPTHCPKCGIRERSKYPVEATKEDIEKYDAKVAAEARAVELCTTQNIAGLFKIPDEAMRGPVEVRNALSNLLAPLEGDVLAAAQKNVIKAAKAGVQGGNEMWVELFYQAIQQAIKATKGAKTVAA